jgi:lactobin A/cerein 7B family class IIb bacteriocin
VGNRNVYFQKVVELSDDELQNVSGGFVTIASLVIGGVVSLGTCLISNYRGYLREQAEQHTRIVTSVVAGVSGVAGTLAVSYFTGRSDTEQSMKNDGGNRKSKYDE